MICCTLFIVRWHWRCIDIDDPDKLTNVVVFPLFIDDDIDDNRYWYSVLTNHLTPVVVLILWIIPVTVTVLLILLLFNYCIDIYWYVILLMLAQYWKLMLTSIIDRYWWYWYSSDSIGIVVLLIFNRLLIPVEMLMLFVIHLTDGALLLTSIRSFDRYCWHSDDWPHCWPRRGIVNQ